MSITDELREFMAGADGYELWCPRHKNELTAIADRIDAEHEAACAEAYGDGVMSVPIALDESQWVKLPVDADGVPIRVGDVMDSKVDYLFDGKPFTVRALVLCEDGWEVGDGRFGNRYEPDSLHHHHEPTVEDVLRDVVTLCHNTWKEESPFHFYDVDDVMKSGNIAEFVSRLRLAGEGE